MTYSQLLDALQSLTKEQLQREVTIYDSKEDWFIDPVDFRITKQEAPTIIEKNYPYLVV